MPGFEENLQNLVAWARDGVTHDPNRLFRAIVMQFLSQDNPPADEDRPNLLKILKDTQPKVDLTLRQDLARQISKYAKPPSDLVRVFANDELAVARIVLETSAGLSDEDLIDIARKGTVAHRQAIVMRRGLSPAVRVAVFGAGMESDKEKAAPEKPTETAETATGTPEAEPSEPSALNRLEMALDRHGRRPIKRDAERAKEFLNKIQSLRPPAQRASLVERAGGHRAFDDIKDIDDEPKTEDVERAEAFLAQIGQQTPSDAPSEALELEEEISAAPEEPVEEPVIEEVAQAAESAEPEEPAGEPEPAVEPVIEPETPVEMTAEVESAPIEEDEDESVLELTELAPPEEEEPAVEATSEAEPESDEDVLKTIAGAVNKAAEEETESAPEKTEQTEQPEEAEAITAEAEAVTEEAPEPEEEPVEETPEPVAEPPHIEEPLPAGELLVAGDLFRKGRPGEQAASRLTSRAAEEGDYARAATDWAWETSPDAIVTYLSEGAGQALGVSESRVLNKPLYELGQFTGDGFDARKAKDAMARRVPYRDQIFETVTDAGGKKSWLVSAVPVFELRSGRFRGFRGVAAAHDGGPVDAEAAEAQTRALEETVKSAQAESQVLTDEVKTAQAGIAARSDNMASVSHELRTPLNAIMGFSDAMASETFGPLDPKYREYAKDILTSASEVNQIINDVLDKSKLDAGAMTVSSGPVPLMMLLEQARNDITPEAESRGMDLTYAATKTDLVVDVDADYAQRIVTTVLRSAVRFGKKGGRIGIESLLERPGVAQINIWNDGPPLSAQTIAAMLPPKPEPGQTEQEPQVGLGLTLTVARGLARLMKGDVMLQSKEGVGNRFVIEFPINE